MPAALDQTGGHGRPRKLMAKLGGPSRLHLLIGAYVLLAMALLLSPALLLVESDLEKQLVEDRLHGIEAVDRLVVGRLVEQVDSAERSARGIARLLSMADRVAPGDRDAFERLVGRDPDGAWRSRPEVSDGRTESMIWIPAAARVDEERRSFFVRAKSLLDTVAPIVRRGALADVWVLPASSGIIIFWPDYPRFAVDAAADHDYAGSTWLEIVHPRNDPTGEPRWTAPTFDPVPRTWMTSVVAPFALPDGSWGGSVGHDVTIANLHALLSEAAAGTDGELMVIDDRGGLILSSARADLTGPAGRPVALRELGDPALEVLLERAREGPPPNEPGPVWRISNASEEVVASRLPGPGWTILHRIPRTAIVEPVERSFRLLRRVLALGLGFILIGSLVSISQERRRRREHEREREEIVAREREARRAAEAATRAKDEFLATVSHELRTPLAPILAWAQALREAEASLAAGGRDEMSPEERSRALEAIERNALGLLHLIDDLLDVSRIVAGKLELRVGNVDLAAVVESVLDALEPALDAKSLHVDLDVDVDAGAGGSAALVDPDRARQIAWNLLSNAVKFTPQGGWIRISVRRDDRDVELRVRDTGEGISASDLPRVFDRFWQAGENASRPHGGVGLGLGIVRHLVELHGGTVRAESEGVGRGALFVVRLPAVPDALEQALATA